MGHTNSTANLALPQFIGTDKPTWLGDVNGAFAAIDAYAGTNDAAVAAAVSDASSAVSQASTAVNTANTANTTAGNASTAANNAVGVANTASNLAGAVDTKVGLLIDLNTTDKSSIVNAINEVDAKTEGVHVIATAAANQSYSTQLTALENDFTALTADQKVRAVLIDNDTVYHIANTGIGFFTINYVYGSDIYMSSMQLGLGHEYRTSVNGVVTDSSASTNTHDLVLAII